ncbi:hypothetical protein GTO89_03145 [Heliobacterium gestii]|uniref:Peptidase M15C domain-containing protein n=1 Tax=Heliomicrobium gestii TaxID=2699 RepID=A0A845L8W3_HELGE|nr:M15 family metallopeptidase [Heliomicrobium gestii]MBM7865785.1 hypothetical protein [Heliomicrobium gestii]MZP42031.1 hypothetical protein [Heliomicrobium gestii]
MKLKVKSVVLILTMLLCSLAPAFAYAADPYPKTSPTHGKFGQFKYKEASGGRIEIDPSWSKSNIVSVSLPGVNKTVSIHKNAKDALVKAFTTIKNDPALLKKVKTLDGTWVPRHISWDASKPLSEHSWGIAIDINASANPQGSKPTSDNKTLWEKAFKPAGFNWGGNFSGSDVDGMHFEMPY